MKKEDYLIKVTEEGSPFVHLRNIGPTDHVTVCGLDGGDQSMGQQVLPLERGDKLNCSSCLTFYENRKGLSIKKDWVAPK